MTAMDERELYPKVMRIEEARKQCIPMPEGVKIPKSARKSSSGGRCNNCGRETMEGHEDAHGMWHYRCPYCVAHQKPSPDPCPRCRCTVHDRISEMSGLEMSSNPFKPDVIGFRCLNCSFEWFTSEYEKYLLTRVVKSVLPKSGFAEKRRG